MIRVTPENLSAWKERVERFSREKRLDSPLPTNLVGKYITVSNENRLSIQDPEEIIDTCKKCGGTGIYRWGPGLRYSGPCFDCVGKGFLTRRDRLRDDFYHEKKVEAAMRADAMRMK